MPTINRLLDPYGLIEILQDDFFTSRRSPQDILRAIPLPSSGLNSLPDEVLLCIVDGLEHGGQEALNCLGRTCHRLYSFVIPSLYSHLVVRKANFDLVHRALCAKPFRKIYVQKLTLELLKLQICYDDSPRVERKRLVKLFKEIVMGCGNLQTVELQRDAQSQSWRSSIHSGFLKGFLKPLGDLPSLSTLDCTRGAFLTDNFPVLSNIAQVTFCQAPCIGSDTPWEIFPKLQTFRLLLLHGEDEFVHFFVRLSKDKERIQSGQMSISHGGDITDLVFRASPELLIIPGEQRRFYFDLSPAFQFSPTLNQEKSNKLLEIIHGIMIALQIERVTLLYSVPRHWRPLLHSALRSREIEGRRNDEVSRLSPEKVLNELVFQRYGEATSKVFQSFHYQLQCFATLIETATRAKVDLEFVDTLSE